MYFLQLRLSALVALAASASALVIDTFASPWTSGETVTVYWSKSSPGDPSTIDILLVNVATHDSFAIADNVPIDEDSIEVELPIIPQGDYGLEAVSPTDIDEVYAQSAVFAISAA